MHRPRPSLPTTISLLALSVALGGTAIAAAGMRAPAGGEPEDPAPRASADAPAAALSAPKAQRAFALGSGKLRMRSASAPVQGGEANGNYNSVRVTVRCARGEVAVSSGTDWSEDRDNFELATVYSRLLVERGRPKGAVARGASDEPGDRTFSVHALCVRP